MVFPNLLPEDDNTFAPPALSAYGIALLSDKTDYAKHSLTIYDAKDNTALKNSLKSRLSVHFNSSKNQGSLYDDGNTPATATSLTNTNGTSNTSNHNISSINMSSHTLSGLFSSSNIHDENDENDEHDHSADLGLDPAPGGLESRPVSNGFSNPKRSRLTRRFKSLGPPKRASEVTLPVEMPPYPSGIHLSPHEVVTPVEFKTPARNVIASTLEEQAEPRTAKKITSESSFFKSLELLKQKSPGLGLTDLPEQFPSAKRLRPRAEHQVAPVARQRVPLQTISPNYANIENGAASFRKPKAPKLAYQSSSGQDPINYSLSRKAELEEPAHPIQMTQMEESKRRNVIVVNSHQYEKLELIGRGGTSKVYKVRRIDTNKHLAIKKVAFDLFDETCVNCFKGEIDLLTRLKQEVRVVRLVDHAVNDGSIYLVMECGDIDLAHVLLNKLAAGSALDLNFVRFHAIEILKCVQAVHRAGIVHSDLKPANFLFVKGILKIIDFGIADAVPDHTANVYRESQIGTPNYMAPETMVEITRPGFSPLVSDKKGSAWKSGRPSDIWSCGCIIYQMIYGRPPYGSYSGQARIMAIMNPQVKIQYPSKGIGEVPVPTSAIELMQKCLERTPGDRWTVEQCLNSSFLKPRAVSKTFVKDLVYSAVNFGYNARLSGEITDDVYDRLVETVLKQIEDLNYA